MESALRPREIQSRIRAGQSVDEVAEVAGLPPERLQVFAGPVIAEREHVASLALATTVRRRGETSAHRNLRTTVAERLLLASIDADTVDWDSWRMDDGRWSVSAKYRGRDDSDHTAIFHFDLRGKFSVAGNDDARWLLGEHFGRSERETVASDPDHEPTVDLTDELALVRATQEDRATIEGNDAAEPPPGRLVTAVPAADQPIDQADEPTTDIEPADAKAAELVADDTVAEVSVAEDTVAEDTGAVDGDSALDTLYDMMAGDDLMGGDGSAEDSVQVDGGLSDATAVPETDNAGWEPALVVDYPAEPGPVEEPEQPALVDLDPEQEAEETAAAEQERSVRRRKGKPRTSTAPEPRTPEPMTPEPKTPEPKTPEPKTPEPKTPEPKTTEPASAEAGPEPSEPEVSEPEVTEAPPKKTANKKRAAVPSWDEIMFGGPPREKR